MPKGVYKRTKKHKERLRNQILDIGKNTRFKAGHLSYHTLEGDKKVSEALKGKTLPGQHRFKEGHTINTGRKHSIETRRKIGDAERGEKHFNWQGGISFEPYSLEWTNTLRRSIRERDNYICQASGQYGNIVHHIDYNKKNCNSVNLITLSKSWNSKVNYNREYWTDYFNEKQRQRQIYN